MDPNRELARVQEQSEQMCCHCCPSPSIYLQTPFFLGHGLEVCISFPSRRQSKPGLSIRIDATHCIYALSTHLFLVASAGWKSFHGTVDETRRDETSWASSFSVVSYRVQRNGLAWPGLACVVSCCLNLTLTCLSPGH